VNDMKRHLVMDLFFGDLTEGCGKWNSVFTSPKGKRKVIVKTIDGIEMPAYFYEDLGGYWECKSRDKINNVIEWSEMKGNES